GQEHVGHDEVEPAGDRAGVVEHGHAVGDAVAGGVGAGGRPGLGVDVDGDGGRRAQRQRGDRQHAAAAADVEHPLTAGDPGVDLLEHEAGGGVGAVAEGPAGVDDDVDARAGRA